MTEFITAAYSLAFVMSCVGLWLFGWPAVGAVLEWMRDRKSLKEHRKMRLISNRQLIERLRGLR